MGPLSEAEMASPGRPRLGRIEYPSSQRLAVSSKALPSFSAMATIGSLIALTISSARGGWPSGELVVFHGDEHVGRFVRPPMTPIWALGHIQRRRGELPRPAHPVVAGAEGGPDESR